MGGQQQAPSAAARARNALLALRIGVTLLASLGGVAVYIGLGQLGVNNTLAVLLGLGFALLARQAASSLLVDALVRRARQARAGASAASRGDASRERPASRGQ